MCSIPDDFGDQKNILRDQNSGKRGNVKHSSRFCSFFSWISTLPVYLKVKATSYMATRSPQVRDVEPVDGVFPGFPLTLCTRQSISTYYTIASISFHIYIYYIYIHIRTNSIPMTNLKWLVFYKSFVPIICSCVPSIQHWYISRRDMGHGNPWDICFQIVHFVVAFVGSQLFSVPIIIGYLLL